MFYLDLFRALAEHRVRYVVVGGLALNLHGVERATMDVDLAIALDAKNLSAAIDVLAELDLMPIAPVALDDARDPATLRRWRSDKHMLAFGVRPSTGVGPTVDILTELPLAFDTLALSAVVKRIAAIDVPVASVEDLIAMKRAAGRAIDLADIEALEALKRLRLGH